MTEQTQQPPTQAPADGDAEQSEDVASGAEAEPTDSAAAANVHLAAEDLIPDRALTDAESDALDHDAVAAVLTSDIRSLVELGLLTKRKKSPLAKMLGWLTD